MPGSNDVNPASPRVKLTYDDFVLFPDDGKRHELIDGEHYVTPSPNLAHQRAAGALFGALYVWLQSHPVGEVFMAPFDVLLSPVDVVEPDLLYISNDRKRAILTAKHVTGAPELVVEIASPGTRARDETVKRRLFEREGVREYWVIDPDVQTVRVYLHEDGAFGRPTELSRERRDVLATRLLPGFEIPLELIFRSDLDPAGA
jgi:Uma2 family endonuclease